MKDINPAYSQARRYRWAVCGTTGARVPPAGFFFLVEGFSDLRPCRAVTLPALLRLIAICGFH